MFHSRMEHIIIYFYFVRDQIIKYQLCVSYFHTSNQLIDSLRKTLIRYFSCIDTRLASLTEFNLVKI